MGRGTLEGDWDGLGEPRGGPGRVVRPSGKCGTVQGGPGRVGGPSEAPGHVEDPRIVLEGFVGPLGRFQNGQGTLGRSGMGRRTLGEVQD